MSSESMGEGPKVKYDPVRTYTIFCPLCKDDGLDDQEVGYKCWNWPCLGVLMMGPPKRKLEREDFVKEREKKPKANKQDKGRVSKRPNHTSETD